LDQDITQICKETNNPFDAVYLLLYYYYGGCIYTALKAGLRISIHFIRIRIQRYSLNTDPDPGL
jgi:hypothetical protein